MNFISPIDSDSSTGGNKWDLVNYVPSGTAKQEIINFTEYFSRLSKKTKELEDKIEKLNQESFGIKTQVNFVFYIAITLIISFFLATVPIIVDYYKNIPEFYQKTSDKVQQLKDATYSKEEVDKKIRRFKKLYMV